MKSFCVECERDTEYKIVWEPVQMPPSSYRELVAICLDCGKEMYVPEINDINVDIRKGNEHGST